MDFRPEQWKVPNLVLSKALFDRLLDLELKRSFRYQSFTSLLLMEATQNEESSSKENSSVGFLEKLARLLRKELRETDIVGAGEGSVAVILIHSDKRTARVVGDRLLSWLSSYFSSTEVKSRCCFGMGGACFPSHATDSKGLFQKAAEMLERSKQQGGRSVCVSD